MKKPIRQSTGTDNIRGMRKSLLNVIIALAGTAASLLVLEIAFRLLVPALPAARPVDRPHIHFFSEKSRSDRDYSYEKVKPANTYRIAVVGDSFAYGYGNLFDDAFPKRLERILNLNITQPRVEVMNFSVPGYSSRNEVLAVRRVLKEWSPDLIFLEITLNDPEMKQFNPHDKKMAGSEPVTGGVFDYWKSLAWAVSRIRNTMSVHETRRYYQKLFEDDRTLSNFRVSLRNIANAASKANVKLAAVIFPLFSFSLEDDSYPFFHAHDVIHDILGSLGVPYLDLYPRFRGLDPYRLQADPVLDPHPNEIAHRIAAEELYYWLPKNNLVPVQAIPRVTAKKRIGPMKLKPRRRHSGGSGENKV